MLPLPMADVIVVHYKSNGQAEQLVGDLVEQRGLDLRVILVECGSDGTLERIEKSRTDQRVHVVRPGANLGYCAGNNYGAGEARAGAHVVVCNPDVRIVDQEALVKLVLAVVETPHLGVAAPLLRTAEGKVEYLGSTIDLDHARAVHTDVLRPHGPDTDEVRDLPWVNGALMVFAPEAWAQQVGFDERYFLFCEEVDWCIRARLNGWTTGLHCGVEVEHRRGGTFEGRGTKAAYYYHRNLYILCRTFTTGWAWRAHWLMHCLRTMTRRHSLRSGSSLTIAWGMVDAARGRTGPRPFRP